MKKVVFLLLSISFMLFLFSCGSSYNLILENTYQTDVPEPSGLVFDSSSNELLTVSDKTGNVYRISLEGEFLGEISFLGVDLEGITLTENKNYIYILEEETGHIIKYDLSKKTIEKEIEIPKANNKKNKGLEGLTYNSKNNKFYALNEKKPGLLYVFDEENGVTNKYELDFAKDYSGICYDNGLDLLWIISDESETLTACNLDGTKIQEFRLPVTKAEGITLNSDETKLFVISDKTEELYIFKKPNITIVY